MAFMGVLFLLVWSWIECALCKENQLLNWPWQISQIKKKANNPFSNLFYTRKITDSPDDTSYESISKAVPANDLGRLFRKSIERLLDVVIDKAAPCFFIYITTVLILEQLVKTSQQITSIIHGASSEFDASKIAYSNFTRFLSPNATLTLYEWDVLSTGFIDPSTISEDLDELGGIDTTKISILSICEGLNSSQKGSGNTQPISFLLFGPPGCGKQLLLSINLTPLYATAYFNSSSSS